MIDSWALLIELGGCIVGTLTPRLLRSNSHPQNKDGSAHIQDILVSLFYSGRMWRHVIHIYTVYRKRWYLWFFCIDTTTGAVSHCQRDNLWQPFHTEWPVCEAVCNIQCKTRSNEWYREESRSCQQDKLPLSRPAALRIPSYINSLLYLWDEERTKSSSWVLSLPAKNDHAQGWRVEACGFMYLATKGMISFSLWGSNLQPVLCDGGWVHMPVQLW